MTRILILAIFLTLSVGAIYAQVSLEERGYMVYIPSTYNGDEALPLVITLHGYGDTGAAYARGTNWAETAEEYGFVVGFLNGYQHEWNSSPGGSHNENDTAAILEFIEFIAGQVHINPDRIYLVGFSNGGSMAYRALCETDDMFAGVAVVSGLMWRGLDCDTDAQASLLVIHGTADTVVPFMGSDDTLSSPQVVTYWSQANNCRDTNVREYDEAYTGLQIQFYQQCDEGAMVMLYAIPGLGHTWPGANQRAAGHPIPHELNANFIIWGFFEISYETQMQQSTPITSANH
jgi:polyhydroxybutyrate depolymerase